MNCPICEHVMKKVRSHKSYNPNEDNKAYDHNTYHCPEDDVWVTTEIPVKQR